MSDSAHLVSVIIPTFNRGDLIGRSIRSVLAQTHHDWECVVVDDCSADHTRAVVEGFNDPRIRYLRREENGGGSAARNSGIEAAQGTYLAFLDSDDEWIPDKLSRQLELFHNSKDGIVGCVVCGVTIIDKKNREFVRKQFPESQKYEEILSFRDWKLTTSCFVLHRSVVEAGIRFDENFPCYQDWDLIVRIAQKFKVDSVAEPLVKQYRNHQGCHVWVKGVVLQGRLKILEKYGSELMQRPAILADFHRKIARSYLRAGDRKSARRHMWTAFRTCPSSVGRVKLLWNLYANPPRHRKSKAKAEASVRGKA
jgi:glycosyltransferase involved in cell wall biosynthesis